MRIRLGSLFGTVAALAVGFAFARIYASRQDVEAVGFSDVFNLTITSSLVGVAIAQAGRLLIERARGRGPDRWGWGRVSWCISGCYHLIMGFAVVTPARLGDWIQGEPPEHGYFEDVAYEAMSNQNSGQVAWILLAYLVVARLARFPRDPDPDLREWSGRAYVVLMVVAWTIEEVIYGLGLWSRPYWGILPDGG